MNPNEKRKSHYSTGLAFMVQLGSGDEGIALPQFWPSPMGRRAGLESSWGKGKSSSLVRSRRPSAAARSILARQRRG
jgi:hypothetical protein